MDKRESRGESPFTLDEVMSAAFELLLPPKQEPYEATVAEIVELTGTSKGKIQGALVKHIESGLLTRRLVLGKSRQKSLAYAPAVRKEDIKNEDAYINAWKDVIVKLSEA